MASLEQLTALIEPVVEAAGFELVRVALIDGPTLAAWLDEIDNVALQALVIKLCAQVIEADGEVHPGESMLLRAALERWVLPMEDQECVEPLVYGLDFQVVPRPGISMPG